jgi:hypothetical protein
VGRVDFTQYLDVHYVPGTGELLIFCMALIGGGLGFLWYNAPPAAIFMGDTGSLSLGGALGAIAVLTKHEIVWAIIGGVFVAEALSVIIQVFWFKRTGRRVFLMAPIHHHFEKKGYAESQIVIRFWIIAYRSGHDWSGDFESPVNLLNGSAPIGEHRMITVQGMHGRLAFVLGMGRSGLVAAQALEAGGADVLCWDDGEAGRPAGAGGWL